jgi:hypothetical protein
VTLSHSASSHGGSGPAASLVAGTSPRGGGGWTTQGAAGGVPSHMAASGLFGGGAWGGSPFGAGRKSARATFDGTLAL